MKKIYSLMLMFIPVQAMSAVTIYLDEASYKSALVAHGYAVLHESFENNVAWADSRNSIINPGSTAQVSSQGIVWSSNYPTNNVSTGDLGGSTVDGDYGFYSNPHGNPDVEWRDSVCDVPDPIPEQCFLHDGFVGTSESTGTFYGVGGWIDGTFGADVTLLLDGVAVDFGAASNISGWTFFGVIDTAGFNSFEFQEVDHHFVQSNLSFA